MAIEVGIYFMSGCLSWGEGDLVYAPVDLQTLGRDGTAALGHVHLSLPPPTLGRVNHKREWFPWARVWSSV